MKQLVILSGKGGTGKTSVAASFAHLALNTSSLSRVILADADVDAANLKLVLHPIKLETQNFIGGSTAVISPERCQGCGNCAQVCRFDAVISSNSKPGLIYRIDPVACEGCAACVYQCPEAAIQMEPQSSGLWYLSASRYGALFHADLYPAQENSGKLVTLVKQQARLYGTDTGAQLVMVDGPPGIGCPVISAAAGADIALIVTEPTAAGIHDMERALKLTHHFRVPSLVCINKADIYLEGANQIKSYCNQRQIEVVGSIPFDKTVTQAMMYGKPVTIYQPDAPASRALVRIWQRVAMLLDEKKELV